MMRPGIGLLLCITLALVSCAGPAAPVAEGTLTPSRTQPYLTATQAATATETVMPTITPTRTPNIWPKPEGTHPTTELEYPEGYLDWSQLSPNGEWVAWGICCPYYFPHARFERLDETLTWDVYHDFSQEDYSGYEGLYPVHWSADNQYVYVAARGPGDGPILDTGIRVTGLLRLDLVTGEIVTIHDIDVYSSYTGGFSSDSRYWAYLSSREQPLVIHILDLTSFQDRTILFDEEYWLGGSLLWSPNDSKIAFFYTDRVDWTFGILNLDSEELTTYSRPWDFPMHFPEVWLNEDELRLYIPYSEFPPLVLNIHNGEITEVEQNN